MSDDFSTFGQRGFQNSFLWDEMDRDRSTDASPRVPFDGPHNANGPRSPWSGLEEVIAEQKRAAEAEEARERKRREEGELLMEESEIIQMVFDFNNNLREKGYHPMAGYYLMDGYYPVASYARSAPPAAAPAPVPTRAKPAPAPRKASSVLKSLFHEFAVGIVPSLTFSSILYLLCQLVILIGTSTRQPVPPPPSLEHLEQDMHMHLQKCGRSYKANWCGTAYEAPEVTDKCTEWHMCIEHCAMLYERNDCRATPEGRLGSLCWIWRKCVLGDLPGIAVPSMLEEYATKDIPDDGTSSVHDDDDAHAQDSVADDLHDAQTGHSLDEQARHVLHQQLEEETELLEDQQREPGLDQPAQHGQVVGAEPELDS